MSNRPPVVILTQAEFGKRVGVGRATVSAAAKDGRPLAPAKTKDGKINAAHPAAVRWAESRGASIVDIVGERMAKRVAEARDAQIDVDLDASVLVDDLMDMTLGELTDRFGSTEKLKEWLLVRKTAEEIKRLSIHNERARRELIERSTVEVAIDDLSRAIVDFVTNSPQTIVIENRAMAQSGTSTEEAIASTRKIISGELRPGLDACSKRIRDAVR